jgi:hypothetical protein
MHSAGSVRVLGTDMDAAEHPLLVSFQYFNAEVLCERREPIARPG